MSWIKKGNLVAVVVVLAGLWLLLAVFLDPLLRRAIVGTGQAAAGARVEIGSLRTNLAAGKLTVTSAAVANKNDPMRNLLEFEEAVLQFSPGAALRGKAVIPEAAIRGMRFGTQRRTSGALPRGKPSAIENLVQKQLQPAKQTFEADLGKAKDVVAEIDPKKLASLNSLDAAQDRLSKTADQWKDKLRGSEIEGQVKEIQAQVQSLQGGGSSAAEIARKAQSAAQIQQRIKVLLAQVETSRGALRQEFDNVHAQLREADELRKKDVNGLLEAAGLPSLDADSLTRHLLGPAASKKLSTAMYWISWARKRNAAQAAKAEQRPPRRRGVNFEFPRAHAYPAFLLEKAQLTGQVADLYQGQDMALEGLLQGLTSNAPLYGQPTRLTLKGSVPGGGPAMSLVGTLDQTRAPGGAELNFQYAGLPLAGMGLGDEGLGASLQGGLARLNGTIRISGDHWKGSVMLQADGVKLLPQVKLAGPAAGFAAAALSGISRFNATIGIEGKEEDLHFSIRSDLGQTLADGMKKAFSAEIAKQRKLVEDKINALYASRAKEIRSRADELQKGLLAPLEKQQAALQDLLKQAAAKSVGKSIPGLDKLFRR